MGRRKKVRNLLGILKDKASLIKAIMSINRQVSSINVAVLRATTHNPSSPPSENRIAAVLTLGHSSRITSCACIVALMDRLHATNSAAVALKCLLTSHSIVTKGSFILKDQISFYPSSGGQNFLNLSNFRDESDSDTWELSSWVRWYAAVVEQNLTVSRSLGYYYSSSLKNEKEYYDNNNKLSVLLNSELVGEIDVLVDHVERTCDAPENLNLQRNSLVYEVVTMVGEDYRLVQRELLVRFKEIGDRMESLSSSELTRLLSALKRLEDCKERLVALFVNRRKNAAFWDLIRQMRTKLVEMKEKREQKKLEWKTNESTRFWNPFAESGGPIVSVSV